MFNVKTSALIRGVSFLLRHSHFLFSMDIMEGKELNQKIRSAIKAKLVDLGAYVDDELPDYIMVMVANKKTTEQMTDDLNLFLGDNTDRFTEWLTAILNKLHSMAEGKPGSSEQLDALIGFDQDTKITPELEAPPVLAQEPTKSQPEPTAKSISPVEVKRTTESRRPKDPPPSDSLSTTKKPEKPPDTNRKRSSGAHISTITTDAGPSPPKKSRTSTSESQTDGQTRHKSTEETEPEIEIDVTKDVLEDEPEPPPAKKPHSKVSPTVKSSENRPTTSRSSTDTTAKSAPHGATRTSSQNTERMDTVVAKNDPKSHGSSRNIPKSSSMHSRSDPVSLSSRLGSGSSDRKRSISSAIGAVVKRDITPEEEYDPYKPAIGNVASVVKVTERKCKVPSTWQADKSILLKAVSAAQDSIEKSKRTAEKERAVVKPVVQQSELKRSRSSGSSSVRSRLGSSRRERQTHRGLRSDRVSSRRSPTRGRSERTSHSVRRAGTERSTRPDRGTGTSERSIEVFQRSRDEDIFDRIKSKVQASKDSEKIENKNGNDKNDEAKYSSGEEKDEDSNSEKKSDNHPEDVLELLAPEDNRLIEYEVTDESILYRPTPISRSAHQAAVVTLVESGAEESDFTDGEGGDDQRLVKERERSMRHRQRSESPKFVVTLDGVDPDLLKKDVKFDSDNEGDTSTESPPKLERNIVRVEPRLQVPVAPQITVSLGENDDADYEEEEMETVSDLAGGTLLSSERCRFWPNCKNGNTCPYHHPSEPCPNFPRCKYRDKCLYVHPTCKYDATCTRPKCQFAHVAKKLTPPFATSLPLIVQPIRLPVYPAGGYFPHVAAQQQLRPQTAPTAPVTCKFFPKCTNMSCPFPHPKPCRFGISCNNKDQCPFSHPKLPSRNQFKWSPLENKKPTSPETSKALT